jgi:photosystem II stability/assembly factor-like uncharacterized protein
MLAVAVPRRTAEIPRGATAEANSFSAAGLTSLGPEGEEDEGSVGAAPVVAPPATSGSARQIVRARASVERMIKRDHRMASQGLETRAQTGARSATWRSLGPSNLGGRTHGLVIDPTDPNVMYAGGIGGGVWKTTDGGQDWNPLSDTLSNIAIGSLEMDPKDPKTLYAGTGDVVEIGYRTSGVGAGIMKTTDGGANWQFLPETQKGNFEAVGAIKVSHNDSQRVYAATNTGLWRSNDGGQTWSQLFKSSAYGCTDLALRTDVQPDSLLFSCGGIFDTGEGVFRSNDGGDTIEQVIANVNGQQVGRAALAFAPSNQSVVYASVSGLENQAAGTDDAALALLRSDQGGAPGSWTIQNEGNGSRAGTPDWLSNCWRGSPKGNGQGSYGNVIAVDPKDPDRIWVGGVDMYSSSDAGKTLGIASYWWLYYTLGLRKDRSGTQYMHADFHVITFDPRYDGNQNTTVYFGNDGGIFRTDNGNAAVGPSPYDHCENGAASKVQYREVNKGYTTALFREGMVSNDGGVIVGGLQDNGTWLDDSISGVPNDWVQIDGGDGSAVGMDPTGNTVYSTTQFGGISKSIDKGVTSQQAMTGIGEQGAFFTPLEIDPSNPNVLWSGRAKMWRTTDGATTWTAASMDFPGSPYGSQANSIAVAPSDSNVVYVGTGRGDGQVWKTTSALANPPAWVNVSGPMKKRDVSEIAVAPNDPNLAYAAIDTYKFDETRLWKTTDGGSTWTDADGSAPQSLPPAGGLSVAINPLNTSMVYVGTATGIFESLDGGASWHIANENLASTAVEDLYFRPGTSELYAFTYGRGAYRVDVGNAAPPPNDSLAAATEVKLNPDFKDHVSARLATSEQSDPAVPCGAEGQPQQTKSVWYRLTPPDGGNFEVSTEGSNYDTVVAVYTGGAGSFTPVACDDDSIGQGGDSLVKFTATPQTLYYIEVTRSSDANQEGLGGSLDFRVSRAG